MDFELSLAIMAGVSVVSLLLIGFGVIFSIKKMSELSRMLHSAKRELDEISSESLKLIKNLNDVTSDVKRKLHGLDFVFKPFSHAKEDIDSESRRLKSNDWASDLMECLAAGTLIYKKIKGAIKEYAKK